MDEHGGTAEPARFAAEIAPLLDRHRMTIVRHVGSKTDELSQRTGIPAPALQVLGMLRHTMPDRVVAVDDVLSGFLYLPADQIRSALDQLGTSGALESGRGNAVALTDLGRSVVIGAFEVTQEFLGELWAGHEELVASLLPLADRACAAVATTGGAAVRVVSPVYDPPNASPALRFAERLTPLRFHRFDAHADAWRSAGLTVDEVQALDPGPQLDRIEAETNRWAAAPYCALEPAERLDLLRGLEALPCD